MHIGLWAPNWPYGIAPNGIVTYVHFLREGLLRRGHRVSVLTPAILTSDAASQAMRFTVNPMTRWRRRALSLLGHHSRLVDDLGEDIRDRVLELRRRRGIDLFEMEESFGFARRVVEETSIPVVIKLHGPAFLTTTDATRIADEGNLLRAAGFLSAPSASTLEATLTRYGLSPALAEHVVNPVDVDASLPIWAGMGDRSTLLFVGRFDHLKGADRVMRAFERLARDRTSLRLTIVGVDNGLLLADGRVVKLAEYLDTEVAADIRCRVDYLGVRSPQELADLRAAAAVVIVASRWETQGYAAIEAMLQGCPVVCSNVAGLSELVRHSETGLLFDGEGDALAESIAELLDDPGFAARLGRRARADIRDRFGVDRVVDRTIGFYEDVLRIGGGR